MLKFRGWLIPVDTNLRLIQSVRVRALWIQMNIQGWRKLWYKWEPWFHCRVLAPEDPCRVNKTDWNESIEPIPMNKCSTEKNQIDPNSAWTNRNLNRPAFEQLQIEQKPTEIKIMFNWLLFNWSNLSIMAWLKSHEPSARGPSRQRARSLRSSRV